MPEAKIFSRIASHYIKTIMTAPTDEQLVEGFKVTGDIRCFDALAERYVARIRAMIYPIVLNHADADDLTQETLLRIVRFLPRFQVKSKFSTWLYRIALNTTFDFLRGNHRRPSIALADEAIEGLPAAGASPFDALHDRDRDRLIAEAMASLSPCLRAAITMVAIQGMSPGEAAEAAGCLKATIYRRLHDARRRLRKSLKQSGILWS